MTANPNFRPFIFGTRNATDFTLNILQGQMPEDLYGVVYLAAPSGSVNSEGLPYPEKYPDGTNNREYATPLMNGDGMIYKIDFNTPRQAQLQTKLLKTPCYYADEATCRTGPLANEKHYKHYFFRNMGIARLSPILGARNMLNTAVIPFQRQGESSPRLLATYDVGRPFEFDPQSLELITPIGLNTEWVAATPPLLRFPFPLAQSTAHPVFDPKTRELFMVNYTKSMETLLSSIQLLGDSLLDATRSEEELDKIAEEYLRTEDKQTAQQALTRLLARSEKGIGGWLRSLISKLGIKAIDTTAPPDQVFLMRWNGQDQNLQKWRVLDTEGKDLRIQQCMHQLGITEDYVLLADSSFKFTLDTLINNPFPHNPRIDRFIRELIGAPMLPYLDIYLVKRSELSNAATVQARKMPTPVPLEAIHFSCNYANPNNQITLYAAHNTAACAAEWLRPYDTQATDGQPIEQQMMSLFAIGAMDMGRIGKFVIDAASGEIKQQELLHVPLDPEKQATDPDGKHTWSVGLYTYRGMIAPDEQVDAIRQLYLVSTALDHRTLSRYIYRLYQNHPKRLVSPERLLEYTRKGVPYNLIRVDTDSMQVADFYAFPADYNMFSVQFIPRKRQGALPEGVDPAQDGYLLCTMVNRLPNQQEGYRCEMWLFDAANLSQGPVAVLGHPELQYGFTLHSTWIAQAVSPQNTPYRIDIRQDYDALLRTIWWLPKRRRIRQLFEQYIYPHF
jgi:carotenoid cleavage dioxygenase-like enzyme